jgi:hypothetical protein
MEMWMKVMWAALLGLMLWRMLPVARHWLKNGPRGTSKEWLTTSMLLGGVVLFVALLISLVRG